MTLSPGLHAWNAALRGQAGLTATHLQNFTYDLGDSSSVDGGKVPLSNGRWKDPADGGSTFMLAPVHAVGDLDGDGAADAAGVLVEESSGDGRFYYLFALLSREGTPVQAGPPEWLGDRIAVERLSIDRKRMIALRFLTHKGSDPLCCPTLRIDDRFRIEHGRLVGVTR